MSHETFSSSTRDAEPQVDQRTIDEINALEQNERPDLSPTGSRIVRAAERVNDFLEKRTIGKAHGEALEMHAEFTENKAREAQDEAYASYEENVDHTALRDEWAAAQEAHLDDQHTEALAMNKEFDKNARREARAEKIDDAKQRIGTIGRAGLARLRAGGEIALGLGVMGAEAASRSAKSAAETAALGAMYGADRVKNAAESATLSAQSGVESVREKAGELVDNAKQSFEQTKESAIAYLQEKREAASQRKAARIAARQERRDTRERAKAEEAAALEQARAQRAAEQQAERDARLKELAERAEAAREKAAENARQAAARKSARRQARQEKVDAVRDRSSEIWQSAQAKRRAIGGRVIGFIARARATGQAAAEAWKQYGEQNQL